VKRAVPLLLGFIVSSGALAVLHHEPQPVRALLGAAVAVGASWTVRSAWRGLPPFVTRWLDAGVVTVAALVASTLSLASYGAPYLVLRSGELAVLGGAAVLFGGGLAGLAYTHRRLAVEVAAQQADLAAMRERALSSQLAALSAQINPHFLFNTLNTLAEVVHEDEDAAEDLVTDLAGMMRHALAGSSRRVPLADELDVVRRLLRIEGARLGARLTWSVEVDPSIASLLVPGLLVQPLVENAVRHAVSDRQRGGHIEVVARPGADGGARIEVLDDGPGLPADVAVSLGGSDRPARGSGEAGGGLWNTAERVRLAYGGRGRLEVAPSESGTRLVLHIPGELA
jgi:two-component system LytT family sensor kinase